MDLMDFVLHQTPEDTTDDTSDDDNNDSEKCPGRVRLFMLFF